MAILTDLKNFVILQPYGNGIRYFHTFGTPTTAGHISTADAMRLIAYFLTKVSPKKADIHFQQLASAPKNSELGKLSVPLLAAKKLAAEARGRQSSWTW